MYNKVIANYRYFLKRKRGEGWLRPTCCLQGPWHKNSFLYMLCPWQSHKSEESWRLRNIRRRRRYKKVEWRFSLSLALSPLKFFLHYTNHSQASPKFISMTQTESFRSGSISLRCYTLPGLDPTKILLKCGVLIEKTCVACTGCSWYIRVMQYSGKLSSDAEGH